MRIFFSLFELQRFTINKGTKTGFMALKIVIKGMRLTWLFKNERITSVSGHHDLHRQRDGALRLEPVSLAR